GIPALVDIDNDGDVDVFIGTVDGAIDYFENTGTLTSPVFVRRTGTANPLDGPIAESGNAAPAFADIDNDGDFDVYVGSLSGSIVFYDNEGDANSPSFVQVIGPSVPLTNINEDNDTVPFLIDFDGDRDFDVFIGRRDGGISYYRNIGVPQSPQFTRLDTGSPVGSISLENGNSSPSLIDIDADGALDLFVGEADGTIVFFENVGTLSNPDFSQDTYRTLSIIDVGTNSHPRFADMDNDGDVEALIGAGDGTINYYRSDERVSILSMVADGLPLAPGSLLTYTIFLTHTGDLTATTSIINELPVETTLINSVTVMPTNTAIINVTAPPTTTEESSIAQITAAQISISNIKLETAQRFTVTIPVQITDTTDIIGQTIANTTIAASTSSELNVSVTRIVTVTLAGDNRVDLPIIIRNE
ncbi:MAG: VCBS repeat-containing protein, partial [Okeania sp. SIO3B3]|nr:VCBS repeat-containing protein [Okeania sp. SIO3B3]